MIKRTFGFVAALLLSLGLSALEAQQREIRGRVVNASTGAPLAGASVAVVGTSVGAVTGSDGSFTVRAPEGAVRLRASMLGFKQGETTIPAGQQTANLMLQEDVLNLEGVVVTGQATTVARRNLANAVSTVTNRELERAPAPTIDKALQGKIPGAFISTNSGAPGGGVQVNFRGVSTINGNVEPLYVVDGVVVSNVSIASGANAITAASGGSNASNQDAPVNRIADLNPNDIESIEVLKGASASAIYGSQASNGVILITTKRGRSGRPRVNVSQRFGYYELSNTLGSRQFTLQEAAATFPGMDLAPYFNADGTPRQVFDQERLLAGRRAPAATTSFSVSGGNDNTTYYLSALVQNEDGIIDNTGFDKQAVKLSLSQQLGSSVRVGLSTNVMHSLAQRGLSNNDNTNTSYYMALTATPNFVDLRPVDGVYPANPFTFSNPLQTAALLTNDENVYRAISSLTTDATLARSDQQSLRLTAVAGADYFRQRNEIISPRELQFEADDGLPGTSVLGSADNLNLNGNANLVHLFTPSSGAFAATTSAGIQYEDRELSVFRTIGRNLVTGQRNVNTAAQKDVFGNRERVRNLGLYVQEELMLLDDRLLLTGAVRADRSSANGDPEQFFFYPKASASFQMPDLGGAVDRVKLRAAYGESGNLPLYGYKFTPLDATNNIEGAPGLLLLGVAGDPNIRPERQREFEGGVDVTALNENVQLEFTAFRRKITDFLLQRTLASSTGYTLQRFNGGELSTTGIEAGLSATPIRADNFQWVSRTTFSKTRSKVEELPVNSFRAGGFGTVYGVFQIEEGKSPTQILGNYTNEDGSRAVKALGDANPDFRMGFVNDLSFGAFTFSSLIDWQQGGDVINLTQLLYDAYGVSEDYELPAGVSSPRRITECDPNCSGLERISGAGAFTQQYVQDASFVKVREVSLTYGLPVGVLPGVLGGIGNASISLSARNLFTFTGYKGLDPEVSNFGNQAVARNIDVSPFPPSRSFWLTFDVGF